MSYQDIGRRFASTFLENIREFIASEYGISDLGMEEQALEYVRENYSPDDVFKSAYLENWAEANGYEKVTP